MKNIQQLTMTALFMGGLVFTSCKDKPKENTDAPETITTVETTEYGLNTADFDTTLQGKKVGLYWIKSDSIQVAFTNYGGRVVGLWVPDKNGKMTDVVVGMGSTADYLGSKEVYFGATIGRVGNRIAKGKFKLDGKEYQVPVNNGENALHGGTEGFQNKVWDVEQPDDQTLVLTYRSPDMEMGFPGNLDVKVTYSVNAKRELFMQYEATTDKPTLVNLTNHAFFNLNGEGSGSILDHEIMINADKYTPVDQGLIPSGKLADVKGTPFDFTEAHAIGRDIKMENEQLKNGGGFDHNFVLKEKSGNDGLTLAARVMGDKTGIVMEVFTEEPGLQFYSGNFMKGLNTFKTGVTDDYRTAIALETQHFPDAPNQKDFASIELQPGDTYTTESSYNFSVDKMVME